jgi:hypothetical protein
MAGDWIKMRTNLDDDPRVVEIASLLKIPELHVVGCLWKLWSWANDHSLDGNAIRVTSVTLDRYTGVTGFADALRNVGWLEGRDTALTFPRFAEHNGQTAKKRAETKERVSKHRNAKSVTDVTRKVLPEKRREEKRRDIHTHTPPEPVVPKELEEIWRRWEGFVLERTGRKIGVIEAETALMDLSRRGTEKAIKDVEFTILVSKNATKILDSDNDFEKQAAEKRAGRSAIREVAF